MASERNVMMRIMIVGMVLLAWVLVGCGSGSDEVSSVDAAASPAEYFEALESWSGEIASRMEAVDRNEPTSNDPVEHADFRMARLEVESDLGVGLSQIIPAPDAADAHSDLVAGFQRLMDLEERLADALRVASSASEVLDGPMSAEIESVAGSVLVPCAELLDIARDLEIEVELFCGTSDQ